MKITLLFLVISLFAIDTYGQNKTTYIGKVSSDMVNEINAGETTERKQSTNIEFASRVIKIGSETYSIVSKQFDGISTSTFMCSKGRGNYVIKYIAGEYISVSDKRTPGIEIRYTSLKELKK